VIIFLLGSITGSSLVIGYLLSKIYHRLCAIDRDIMAAMPAEALHRVLLAVQAEAEGWEPAPGPDDPDGPAYRSHP
jgi:hypothetical protein